MSKYEKLLTYKDLQRIFGIGQVKAYAMLKSSCFPTIRINGRMYITKVALERWLEDQEGRNFLL